MVVKPSKERLALTNRVAEVTWIDSSCRHGWHDEDSHTITNCQSIGYVTSNDEDGIVLTESIELGSGSKYGCSTAIPKSAIVKVTYLRNRK